jgi:glycosyltransferase involved in cell wall biosynthesis
MIQAMADVFLKFKSYRLLIIGDGPARAKVEKTIAECQLADRVHLLGILPQKEIAKHLNQSKLFVMSSLLEGFPKALLEAIACGTPAVVTKACNAEDIIEKVGIAVDESDSKALVKAVEEIIGDEERWKRLSRNCLKVAQEYRWEVISGKVLDIYKRLDLKGSPV